MKLIVKPKLVTWSEAKTVAHQSGGRLLEPKEVLKWSDSEAVEFDIWLNRQDQEQESASYFNASKQDIRYRPKNDRCLLVYLADPETLKLQRAQARIEEERERRLQKFRRKAG